MFVQNIALTNLSVNTINPLSVTNQQAQMHLPIRLEHQDGPNTILCNIWHSCWCFSSLSYEIWKTLPDLPSVEPVAIHQILPGDKLPKISRFRCFRGKEKFSGKKRGKKIKIWIFHEKWPIWATFSSNIVPRFFPASCPVFALFLPGSCPVLARFLPGSPRFSSNFLGFFIFLFIRPFLL